MNEDGEQLGGTGFNVSLFEVTIVGGEEGFIAEEIGFGFTDDATVKINGSLSKGAASATDVALCDDFECPPGDNNTRGCMVVGSRLTCVNRAAGAAF